MRNKLEDLNNLLFEMAERIMDDDEDDTELLEANIKKAKALSAISGNIIEMNRLALDATKLKLEYGGNSSLDIKVPLLGDGQDDPEK